MTRPRHSGIVADLSSDLVQNRGESHLSSISVNAAYNAARESVILVTGGGAGVTVTLPSAALNYGKAYWYKKVDAAVGLVTVTRAGADTIDGAATTVLTNQYDSVGLVSDGITTWHIIGGGGGGGGIVPPAGYCWLYCVAIETTYGGVNAASAIAGADYCVALGWGAMRHNVDGDHNAVIGAEAGEGVAANSYFDNAILGYQAGHSLTNGSYSCLIGSQAGQSISSGDRHVFIGYQAGQSMLQGTDNVFVGYQAGQSSTYDSANVAVGNFALTTMDGGGDNVAVGYDAMLNTTTSSYNVAVGTSALRLNTTGESNVAVGRDALEGCLEGIENVAVGYIAGQGTTGDYNTWLGAYAGTTANSGDNNVGVGYQALTAITTGELNTTVGYGAGDLITTGTHNICIGQASDPPANNSTYRLNIGDTIFGDLSTGNNTIGINVATILGQLHVDQDEAAGAIPVLYLDQGDVDEEFIRFDGTSAADQTKSISTVNGDGVVTGPKDFAASAGWAYEGMVRVNINGTDRWVPYYSEDTS